MVECPNCGNEMREVYDEQPTYSIRYFYCINCKRLYRRFYDGRLLFVYWKIGEKLRKQLELMEGGSSEQ